MRKITKRLITRIVQLSIVVIIIITAGAFVFLQFEDWSLIEALYFTTVTLTTVGYGDITPTNDISRLLTILYSLMTIPLFFLMIGLVGEVVFNRYIEKTVHAHIKKKKQVARKRRNSKK